ncbi:MAG TPA: hypothetical protein VGM83_02035 [Devosiaceae bacterium]|jgi:site-specific recombinase XerD
MDAISPVKRFDLVRYRDGLMILFLATNPLRRRNLSALRLNASLIADAAGYRVSFKGSETKTGNLIDMTLAQPLSNNIDFYRTHVRPGLLRQEPDDGWFWLGRRGKPLAPNNISTNITTLTKRYLGRSISPHLFRD